MLTRYCVAGMNSLYDVVNSTHDWRNSSGLAVPSLLRVRYCVLSEDSREEEGEEGVYSCYWVLPSHSYGTLPAIWDHTVLPATRHK